MSDSDSFDALLAQRFEREHQHVPAGPFVPAAMHRIRFERRLAAGVGTALRVAALLAAIAASPWLITGAKRLNAAVEASITWTSGFPGLWIPGALAVVVLLAARLRRR
jgi:hypothetical protein